MAGFDFEKIKDILFEVVFIAVSLPVKLFKAIPLEIRIIMGLILVGLSLIVLMWIIKKIKGEYDYHF